MHYIGKLNKNYIGVYGNKLFTYDVVLTDERKLHILKNHQKDYKQILNIISNPEQILEDSKNENTLFFIGKLEKNNLNVVIKLNTTNNVKHPKNSVMTAWIIRNKNLSKLEEKNKCIYKKE